MKAASYCAIVLFLFVSTLVGIARAVAHATRAPHEVLAFYYTWYGAPNEQGHAQHWNRVDASKHEISDSTHYPTLGAYDSRDAAVIDRQIDEAKAHGLTGFIATWWGQGKYEDKAFSVVLAEAEAKNFKVTVYWETAPGNGQAQIDQAVNDLVYLVSHYGKSKAFLKVKGRPVIFVYGRVIGQVPTASWPAIVKAAHAGAGEFLLIADGYTEGDAAFFGGVHEYNNCVAVKGKNPEALRVMGGGPICDCGEPGPQAQPDQLCHGHSGLRRYEDSQARTQSRAAGRRGLPRALGGGNQGKAGLGSHHVLERVA